MFENPFYIFLGIASCIAFYSLFCQYDLLYSQEGILPLPQYLREKGLKNLLLFASLLSLLLPFIPYPFLISGCLWLFYYLLCQHDSLFLYYQWDLLLLEVLFLSTLQGLCPPIFQSSFQLLWTLLLFRLMWGSGWAKLKSKKSTWKNLTALSYHWYTQPLPLQGAYWIHQMPRSFQKLLTFCVLFLELVLPFFLWLPPLKIYALIAFSFFQLALALTGNFGFFNFLLLALCYPPMQSTAPSLPTLFSVIPALFFTLFLAFLHLCLLLKTLFPLPLLCEQVLLFAKKKQLVASYALFAKMRLERKEILVKYSNDKFQWSYMRFCQKPDQEQKKLPLSSFYLPRLEWQLWFSSFSTFETQSYLHRLAYLLLNGKGPLAITPIPRYLQFELWEFSFSSYKKYHEGIWTKKKLGPYSPILEKKAFKEGGFYP